MFALVDELENTSDTFEQMFIEYEAHSFFVRRLEDGVLLLLNTPIQRNVFKKVQVGVNLFIKPLGKAMVAQAAEPEKTAKQAEQKPSAARRAKRIYRGVEY
jgi:hypothetical protein